MYKIYQYNNNDFRVVSTKFEKTEKNKKSVIINTDDYIKDDEEIQRISLSRSKRLIREYALCNDFKYFFTSTVDSALCDRFSLTETQKKIRRICDYIKRKNKDFKYLFITEKHKNGAFHFHGLCTDLPLYINNNCYYSSKDFDKLGFNSFSLINDISKCSNYITKYITKECVRNEAGTVYFCSKGLKKAYSYEIMSVDFNKLQHNSKHIFENDFCYVCDFRLDAMNSQELLYFRDYVKEAPTLIDILKNKINKMRDGS